MPEIKLTTALYEFIESECYKFNKKTGENLDVNHVLYSYLYSTNNTFSVLNDYNSENVVSFLKSTRKTLTDTIIKQMP